jgi:hypothetical protein
MLMEDIIELTKDYFNKTTMEKELILQQVMSEMLLIINENDLNIHQVETNLNKIINDSVNNEDYEISELFLQVKEKIKRYYGM